MINVKRGLILGLICFLGFSGTLYAEDISLEQVVLRGLDKVTGRLSTMTVNVGEKTTFGALDIYARVCYVHPPEETPENAAYLDVVENKEEGQLKLFSGWMFSSSPALSAMDHAVYDVWVLKCQGEQVTPPVPEPLILENPIEQVPVQPKLKIMLEGNKKVIPETPQTVEEDVEQQQENGQETENTGVDIDRSLKDQETEEPETVQNININEDILEDMSEPSME